MNATKLFVPDALFLPTVLRIAKHTLDTNPVHPVERGTFMGIRFEIDQSLPPDVIEFRQNGRIVGRFNVQEETLP